MWFINSKVEKMCIWPLLPLGLTLLKTNKKTLVLKTSPGYGF